MAQGIVLVQLRMSRTLYGRLREQAEEMGISLNRFLAECLREGRRHIDGSSQDTDETEETEEE